VTISREIIPERGGSFELSGKATFEGKDTETLHTFEVATPTQAARALNKCRVNKLVPNSEISITPDKKEYFPGDQAQILVMVRNFREIS
jgi:hypothetical protein